MSNHQISLQQAVYLTTRYRDNYPSDFFICETYELDAIQGLLAVTGCAYLRIYLGRKSDNSVVTVLSAANAANEDILPSDIGDAVAVAGPAEGGAVLLEDGYRCPES